MNSRASLSLTYMNTASQPQPHSVTQPHSITQPRPQPHNITQPRSSTASQQLCQSHLRANYLQHFHQ